MTLDNLIHSMILKTKECLVGVICFCIPIIAIFISGACPGGGLSLSSSLESISLPPVMNNFRAVFVTTPNIEVAKKIAHGLVSNKIAACINIIPQITSVYEWEGKINEDTEQLLMIKTEQSKFEQLEKFVKENHPYSVPEIIAVNIEQGSESYLKWIKETVNGPPKPAN